MQSVLAQHGTTRPSEGKRAPSAASGGSSARARLRPLAGAGYAVQQQALSPPADGHPPVQLKPAASLKTASEPSNDAKLAQQLTVGAMVTLPMTATVYRAGDKGKASLTHVSLVVDCRGPVTARVDGIGKSLSGAPGGLVEVELMAPLRPGQPKGGKKVLVEPRFLTPTGAQYGPNDAPTKSPSALKGETLQSYVGKYVTLVQPSDEPTKGYRQYLMAAQQREWFKGASFGRVIGWVPADPKAPSNSINAKERLKVRAVNGTAVGSTKLIPAGSSFYRLASPAEVKAWERTLSAKMVRDVIAVHAQSLAEWELDGLARFLRTKPKAFQQEILAPLPGLVEGSHRLVRQRLAAKVRLQNEVAANPKGNKGVGGEIIKIGTRLMALRKLAFDKGAMTKRTYEAWLALWRVMTRREGDRDQSDLKGGDKQLDHLGNAVQAAVYNDGKILVTVLPGERGLYARGTAFTHSFRRVWSEFIRVVRGKEDGGFPEAVRRYRKMALVFDEWTADTLKVKLKEGGAAAALAATSAKRNNYGEIADKKPTRLPAVFIPSAGYGGPSGENVSLELYYWAEGNKWHLRDVTGSKPWFYTADKSETDKIMPPSILDDARLKGRYPTGRIEFQVPGGKSGAVETNSKHSLATILGTVGMVAGGAALVAATAGMGGIAIASVIVASGTGLVSSVLDLKDKAAQERLTTKDVTLNVAQIASCVAGLGSLGATFRIARGTAGLRTMLAGRTFTAVGLTADGAQLMVLASDLVSQYQAYAKKGGKLNESQQTALGLLAAQTALQGGLLLLSWRGRKAFSGHWELKPGKGGKLVAVRPDVVGQQPSKINYLTSAAELANDRNANRCVGRALTSESDARGILKQLSQGKADALEGIGIKPDEGFDATKLEWGIGKTREGEFVIIRGSETAVGWRTLSTSHGILPVAHSHPLIKAMRLEGASSGKTLEQLTRSPDAISKVFPSGSDLALINYRGLKKHTVFTPFKVDPKTKVVYNGDQAPKTAQPLVFEFTITGQQQINGQRIVTAGLEAKCGGKAVWRGQGYTQLTTSEWTGTSLKLGTPLKSQIPKDPLAEFRAQQGASGATAQAPKPGTAGQQRLATPMFPRWPVAHGERMQMAADWASRRIAQRGVPLKLESSPALGDLPGGKLAQFVPGEWSVRLPNKLFDGDKPTGKLYQQLVRQLQRESDEAIEWFQMARLLAARDKADVTTIVNRLRLSRKAAEAAIKSSGDLAPGSAAWKRAAARLPRVSTKGATPPALGASMRGANRGLKRGQEDQKKKGERTADAR